LILLKTMLSLNKPFPPHVVAFTSERSVDFTLGENQSKLNETQRGYLSEQLKCDLPEPRQVRQIHGTKIILVEAGNDHKEELEAADGLLTKDINLPLAVRCADCLPIFLYDRKSNGIGLIHAGWKGTQHNIVKEAIHKMESQWQSKPKDIQVLLGPAIRFCCYEVGNEFQKYFPGEVSLGNGSLRLDLPAINCNQLIQCGINEANILDCNMCTCCSENYFSYRREGKDAGRMISIMMVQKS